MKKILTIFALAFILSVPLQSQAAILYTGSANQVVYVGETFIVEWYLDTQDKEINSLSLIMTYASDKLEAVEASTGNSAIDLWIKTPGIDNTKGEIKLVGGVSGGVKDVKLPIFRATFKPLQTGDAKISIATESQLLLADGQGTSEPIIFNEINFRINPAEAKPAGISSPTHPNQDEWYKDRAAVIHIAPKEGEQYSYSFSSNLEIIPDPNQDDVKSALTFNNLPDGIYYFKLNSKVGAGNWQEAGVYRVQLDSTPPGEFQPALAKDPEVFNGQPFVSFNATDKTSGVSHYEVKSGILGGWKKTQDSFFRLPGIVLGDKIEVKVVDAAGNERITEIKVDKSIVNSVFSDFKFWSIIIVIAIAAVWIVIKYFRLLQKYKTSEKL